MYEKRRPLSRPTLFIFILAAILISACGTQIAGNSWPGVTANGDVVYVAYGAGVIAVDVVEQEQLWSYPSEASATLQFYARPYVSDGRVIVGDYGASGGFFSPNVVVSVYSLNEVDGEISEDWIQDSIARDRIVAAPVRAGDLVYVGTADNFILALEADTGALAWQFEAEHSIWSAPSYDGGVLYVGSMDKHVYALDGQTGDVKWQQELSGSVSGQVAIGDTLVYVGSFDKQLHALDKETGEIRWEAPENGTEDWVWAAPALVDNVVYFSDKSGNVFAVDAETGQTIWDVQIDTQVVASPVVSDGRIFIASAGRVSTEDTVRRGALIALDAETGEELWRVETTTPVYSTPVLVQDMIVVALSPGAEDLLVVLNQTDGDDVWRYSPPAEE